MRHRHLDPPSITEAPVVGSGFSDHSSNVLAPAQKANLSSASPYKISQYKISQRFRLSKVRRHIRLATYGCLIALVLPLLTTALLPHSLSQAGAQSAGGAIQLKASRVEANSNTGVVTAVGNVRIDYPSRQIFATAAQAQYYSQEQRIVLSGNVDVIQEGNSLKAETVTYLIEEGRFVATPGTQRQVEAVYLLPDDSGLDTGGGVANDSAPVTPPPPPSLPSPPDELPADLSSLNVE